MPISLQCWYNSINSLLFQLIKKNLWNIWIASLCHELFLTGVFPYLCGFVGIDHNFFRTSRVSCGVPQGSILGTLLTYMFPLLGCHQGTQRIFFIMLMNWIMNLKYVCVSRNLLQVKKMKHPFWLWFQNLSPCTIMYVSYLKCVCWYAYSGSLGQSRLVVQRCRSRNQFDEATSSMASYTINLLSCSLAFFFSFLLYSYVAYYLLTAYCICVCAATWKRHTTVKLTSNMSDGTHDLVFVEKYWLGQLRLCPLASENWTVPVPLRVGARWQAFGCMGAC